MCFRFGVKQTVQHLLTEFEEYSRQRFNLYIPNTLMEYKTILSTLYRKNDRITF